jgi:hypothetical protein
LTGFWGKGSREDAGERFAEKSTSTKRTWTGGPASSPTSSRLTPHARVLSDARPLHAAAAFFLPNPRTSPKSILELRWDKY